MCTSPSELGARTPSALARTIRRYEASVRRAARRLGLERPCVITANPLLAGFGAFDWAGPVTFYAWDDWTSDYNRPHLDPGVRGVVRRRSREATACMCRDRSRAGADWSHRSARRHPERHRAGRMARTGRAAGVVRQAAAAAAALRRQPREPRRRASRSPKSPRRTRTARSCSSARCRTRRTSPPSCSTRMSSSRGVAPRRDVVGLIGAADACLIPHVGNRLTEAMSPLKLYEYLAGGRPVAAVDLPPIAAVERSRGACAGRRSSLRPRSRRRWRSAPQPRPSASQFLARHAWSRRFDELIQIALAD